MSKQIVFLILFFAVVLACRERPVNPDPIPQVPVNVTINLALKAPFLDIPGSFFYNQGGSRGLVIVHDFDGSIRAFERTCSFQPTQSCSQLQIDTPTLQFKCGTFSSDTFSTCCKSRFDLSGFVVKPPAQFPLLQYRTSRNGNILNVFN